MPYVLGASVFAAHVDAPYPVVSYRCLFPMPQHGVGLGMVPAYALSQWGCEGAGYLSGAGFQRRGGMLRNRRRAEANMCLYDAGDVEYRGKYAI